MKKIESASLIDLNTFGIEAKAKLLIHYNTEEELKQLIESGIMVNNKVLHIGGGSNLLFLNDYDGTILHSEIKFINIVSENDSIVAVQVGAGVVWDDFVAYAVENGYGVSESKPTRI